MCSIISLNFWETAAIFAMLAEIAPFGNQSGASVINRTSLISFKIFTHKFGNVVWLIVPKTYCVHWKHSFFDIRSKKEFLRIKESFVNSTKISLIQRNRFVYIKDIFFESIKLFSIQRNFFIDRISKKLFFGCIHFSTR